MNLFLNERINLDGSFWIPDSEEVFNENIFNLLLILNSFKFHTDILVYYSAPDMVSLIRNLKESTVLFPGNYEPKFDLLRSLLVEINANDWEKCREQRNNVAYFHQESIGEATHNVTSTSLAEATEYKFEKKLVAVINLKHSAYNDSLPLHINRSSISPPRMMEIFNIEAFSDNNELLQFIINNRTKRNYNHNPKHGENGKNVKHNKSEEVSPLECSIEEATFLLKFAVSIKGSAELYVYDGNKNKYITYKAESQNIYHGYHPIDQSEVPLAVKDFFNKVGKHQIAQ